LRSYGFSDKNIREITENEKMFLKLFRAFHSKSGSKKKHWDISYLIRKIAKPHERKKAKKLIDRFLALNILRRDSGKSVGFSEIGSEISIALSFNQTFAFQENQTSSLKKPKLNIGVQNT
jgi:hypothetical protein